MDCIVYFGELKDNYKNVDNPFEILDKKIELFIGCGILGIADDYFGKPHQFDCGSFVWECELDALKRICKDGKVKIPNIDNLKTDKKYGIVFIEIG